MEISDSIELCIVELTRVDCTFVLFMQAGKALDSLHICTGQPLPLMLDDVLSNKISFIGSYFQCE